MWYNLTLLLQVHDELVFSVEGSCVETAAADVSRLMENAARLDVHLRVDAKAGPNWAAMTRVQAA